MKKVFQISLVVALFALLLSACQGVGTVETPTVAVDVMEAPIVSVPVTGQQAVANDLDYVFGNEDNRLSGSGDLPMSVPTAVQAQQEQESVEGVSAVDALIKAPAGCNATYDTTYEAKIFQLINKERAKQNLNKLDQDMKLYAAAREHSIDMACNNYFSHNSPNGRTPFDRILAAGYKYRIAAENLYAGNGTYNDPEKAVQAWMNSPAHRKNILTPGLIHIGVSYVFNNSSTYGGYLSVTFGTPYK